MCDTKNSGGKGPRRSLLGWRGVESVWGQGGDEYLARRGEGHLCGERNTGKGAESGF